VLVLNAGPTPARVVLPRAAGAGFATLIDTAAPAGAVAHAEGLTVAARSAVVLEGGRP
jgi:hypothetical protein